MKTTRFTDEQIIAFLKQAEAGMSIKELCRSGGFSQPTFYKWRAKFGGMEASDASRLRDFNGIPINGTTTTSISAVSSAVFEGKTVNLVTRTRKNVDANGNELSNSTTQVFLDKNFSVVGEVDQHYRVVTSSALVGGVLLQTEKTYDTAAKQNLYAVNTDSFYAEADPADPTKILLYESGEGKDASGNLINTWNGIHSIDLNTGLISNKFYSSFGKSTTVIYFTH